MGSACSACRNSACAASPPVNSPAFTLGALFLAWYLVSGRSRLKLNFASFAFQRDMFLDILKVGAMSCLSPLQSVLTILIFTKILAGFGTTVLAGYGMGSRLEFLLIPIAFAFGTASIPMVGMAMGAGLVDARAARDVDRGALQPACSSG